MICQEVVDRKSVCGWTKQTSGNFGHLLSHLLLKITISANNTSQSKNHSCMHSKQ